MLLQKTIKIAAKELYGIFLAFFVSVFGLISVLYFNFQSKIEEQNKIINQLILDNSVQQVEIKRLLEQIHLLLTKKAPIIVDSVSTISQISSVESNLSNTDVFLRVVFILGIIGLGVYGSIMLLGLSQKVEIGTDNELFDLEFQDNTFYYDISGKFEESVLPNLKNSNLDIFLNGRNGECIIYYQTNNGPYLPIEDLFIKYNAAITTLESAPTTGIF
jgi:hypothetical protein